MTRSQLKPTTFRSRGERSTTEQPLRWKVSNLVSVKGSYQNAKSMHFVFFNIERWWNNLDNLNPSNT